MQDEPSLAKAPCEQDAAGCPHKADPRALRNACPHHLSGHGPEGGLYQGLHQRMITSALDVVRNEGLALPPPRAGEHDDESVAVVVVVPINLTELGMPTIADLGIDPNKVPISCVPGVAGMAPRPCNNDIEAWTMATRYMSRSQVGAWWASTRSRLASNGR